MNINENINPTEKEDSQKELNNLEANDNNPKDKYYELGWNQYSEITNGRFAMIGFFAIVLIELLSNQSFLQWSGIIN